MAKPIDVVLKIVWGSLAAAILLLIGAVIAKSLKGEAPAAPLATTATNAPAASDVPVVVVMKEPLPPPKNPEFRTIVVDTASAQQQDALLAYLQSVAPHAARAARSWSDADNECLYDAENPPTSARSAAACFARVLSEHKPSLDPLRETKPPAWLADMHGDLVDAAEKNLTGLEQAATQLAEQADSIDKGRGRVPFTKWLEDVDVLTPIAAR